MCYYYTILKVFLAVERIPPKKITQLFLIQLNIFFYFFLLYVYLFCVLLSIVVALVG